MGNSACDWSSLKIHWAFRIVFSTCHFPSVQCARMRNHRSNKSSVNARSESAASGISQSERSCRNAALRLVILTTI